jgi:hypothetical protein
MDKQIEIEAVLTRYIPFVKLISMLEQGFFIPKANLFTDSWEGSLHLFNSEKDNFQTENQLIAAKEWVYVSCWYLDEPESHAMWNSYGQSNDSLAIQTTHRKFKLAFGRSRIDMHARFFPVMYQKPNNAYHLYDGKKIPDWFRDEYTVRHSIFNYLPLQLFHKHEAFSFENEARLVLVDNDATLEKKNKRLGLHFSIKDTREMITKIILHPNSSAWFEDTVRKLINDTYELDIPICKSSLVGHKN